MTVGEKLAKLRKDNGYTQEDLADALGVSRQSVSKWESDTAFPETNNLICLAKLLHCSIDYLLLESGEAVVASMQVQPQKTTKSPYNKKKLPFLITSLATCLFLYILFACNWLQVQFQYFNQITGKTVYISGWLTYYQLIFTGDYRVGNVFALLSLLSLTFSVALAVIYLCLDERKLGLAIRILNCVTLGLITIVLLISLTDHVGWGVTVGWAYALMALLVVLQFAIKPLRKA
ncbi:MAG: helix-turn-helix domain-containing protein [Bacilli bacterium]|nr:helix-turn-helix domain-containing protein [Bacilli bacterium]